MSTSLSFGTGPSGDADTNVPDDSTHTDDEEEEETEEVHMTALEVLQSMERLWINEKFAPDILPYDEAVVEMVMSQLVHMEDNLATANKNDFLYVAHRMEVERIRFVVASYLRCRLQKIESYAGHVLEAERKRPRNAKRLSDGELKFAQQFHNSIEKHFSQLVFRHFANTQLAEDHETRTVAPNLNTHVFVRARQEIDDFSFDDGENTVSITAGSIVLMLYGSVEPLLLQGLIELI